MDAEMREKVYRSAKRMGRAYLATAAGDQPWVRPMQPAWDNNDLLIATWKGSPKVRQIQSNPRVQVFYEVDDSFEHLRVTGVAELVEDRAEKQRLWTSFDDDLTPYFRSPDDPTFALIRVRSSRIELAADAGTGKQKPLVWSRERRSDPAPAAAHPPELFQMLASTVGLDLDDQRAARLNRLWQRLAESSRRLDELRLDDTPPAQLLPPGVERRDER